MARVIQARFPAVTIGRVAPPEAPGPHLATSRLHPRSALPLPSRGVSVLAPMDPLRASEKSAFTLSCVQPIAPGRMTAPAQAAAPEAAPATDTGRSVTIFERVPRAAGRSPGRSRRVGCGGHIDTQSRATVPTRR